MAWKENQKILILDRSGGTIGITTNPRTMPPRIKDARSTEKGLCGNTNAIDSKFRHCFKVYVVPRCSDPGGNGNRLCHKRLFTDIIDVGMMVAIVDDVVLPSSVEVIRVTLQRM